MAQTRDRIIALVLAIVFFITSVGVSGLIVWQAMQGEKEEIVNPNDTKLADFTPVESVTELQTIDTEAGTGQEAKAGDTVTVHYTGAVAATGTIFQSSADFGQPVTFSLDGVIAGWSEGIPGMKAGGKRRLLIPADKAYGPNPPDGSNIPPNAALVFDVTLISVGEPQPEAAPAQ